MLNKGGIVKSFLCVLPAALDPGWVYKIRIQVYGLGGKLRRSPEEPMEKESTSTFVLALAQTRRVL